MDNKNDSYIDLTNGSAEKNAQPYNEYQPAKKQGEFRINGAISPKAFNAIVITVVAGSLAAVVFVVIKLITLFALLF